MTAGAQDVRIVLVRPRNPLNIGAAARAMLNFGFEDLVIVAPHEPVWQESKAAPGAGSVLRKAKVARDLPAAVEDRTLVIATSSLSRREVSRPVVSLDDLSGLWNQRRHPDRVAVVFGPEKTGLSNRDLNYCQWIVRIPTTAHCPSMNLGQAVAVCCYEMKRLAEPGTVADAEGHAAQKPPAPLATIGEVERLVQQIEKLTPMSGKAVYGDTTIRRTQLRQMLLRWQITTMDVTLALGVLRDLRWKLGQRDPDAAS